MQFGSIDATGLGATGPVRDDSGILFDGIDASFEVAAANNPLGDQAEWTLTSVFRVTQGVSRRDANNTGQFWANSMLVGRELPGGNRGDYGLGVNAENELVAGWGQPDGGTLHDGVALNDGEFHVASATFEVGVGLSIYLDGELVNTTDNAGRAMEAETMNFGVNILNVGNDTAYYSGHIEQIILHESSLNEQAIALRVVRHHRDDANSQTEFHVGLDHIRVNCRQHDFGIQAQRGKSGKLFDRGQLSLFIQQRFHELVNWLRLCLYG